MLVASKVQTGVAGSLIVEVEFSLVRVSNANKLTALPRLRTYLGIIEPVLMGKYPRHADALKSPRFMLNNSTPIEHSVTLSSSPTVLCDSGE